MLILERNDSFMPKNEYTFLRKLNSKNRSFCLYFKNIPFFSYVAENYFSATCWAIQIVLCLKKIESWMKRKGFMPAFEDNLFFWHVVEKYFSLTCWAIYTFLFYQNWHFFSSPKKRCSKLPCKNFNTKKHWHFFCLLLYLVCLTDCTKFLKYLFLFLKILNLGA